VATGALYEELCGLVQGGQEIVIVNAVCIDKKERHACVLAALSDVSLMYEPCMHGVYQLAP
jgi:hypothetical protein